MLLTLGFTTCECLISDREYPLYLVNESSFPLRYYLALGDGFATTVYPDTTLPGENVFLEWEIEPKTRTLLYNSHLKWEKGFDYFLIADTLSIFLFHADTLDKYSWKEVRDYNVRQNLDSCLRCKKSIKFTPLKQLSHEKKDFCRN